MERHAGKVKILAQRSPAAVLEFPVLEFPVLKFRGVLQFYLFGRPMPAEELARQLAQRGRTAA
jgi:hypothetical protein